MSDKQYIKDKKVSEITGLALSTIRNDRVTQRRIPYCKVGRSVLYDIEDVLNFMQSHKIS